MSPSSRSRPVSIRVPNDLHVWLQAEAERQGHGNVSQVIVDAMADLRQQQQDWDAQERKGRTKKPRLAKS